MAVLIRSDALIGFISSRHDTLQIAMIMDKDTKEKSIAFALRALYFQVKKMSLIRRVTLPNCQVPNGCLSKCGSDITPSKLHDTSSPTPNLS